MLTELVSAEAMRRIDASCGTAPLSLMENAAKAAVAAVEKMLIGRTKRRVLVAAGRGNNGGDGFALARLISGTTRVRIVTTAQEADLKGEALENFRRARENGIEFLSTDRAGDAVKESDLVVDALLGTGAASRPLTPELSRLIESMNGASSRTHCILALDLPSGIDADTGRILAGESRHVVRADATITFGRAKPGLYLYPGAAMAGEITVDPIGIPDSCFADMKGRRPSAREISPLLPRRSPIAHKGSSKLLVIGGAGGMAGAALLAAYAALKSGTGYVFLSMPKGAADHGWPVEAVRKPLPSREQAGLDGTYFDRAADAESFKLAESVHAVVLGGGLGRGESERIISSRLTRLMKTPAVIDADAIHQISIPDLSEAGASRVITPHIAEFVSLFGGRIDDVERDRIAAALKAAERAAQVVVLKGRPTIIAAPDGRFTVNGAGNELLATCVSGDVLSGLIGSLLAQGLPSYDAAVCGAHLHGMTAEEWGRPVGLTATSIADLIAAAWLRVQSSTPGI